MKQKLLTTLKTALIVLAFVLALCAGLFMSGAPVHAEGENQTVLSDVADFNISDGVLTGVSEAGKNKLTPDGAYSIVVPEEVTEITEGAFANPGRLTAITLPFVGAKAELTDAEVQAGKGTLGYLFGKHNYGEEGSTQSVPTQQIVYSVEGGDGTYFPQGIPGDNQITVTYQLPPSLTNVYFTGGGCSLSRCLFELPLFNNGKHRERDGNSRACLLRMRQSQSNHGKLGAERGRAPCILLYAQAS